MSEICKSLQKWLPDSLEELAVQELVGRVGGLLAARAAAGRRSHPRGVAFEPLADQPALQVRRRLGCLGEPPFGSGAWMGKLF